MSVISNLFRFFTLRFAEGFVVLLLVAFMPNLPPYSKTTDSIKLSPALPLEGKLAVNGKLDDVELWHKGDLNGPEAFADRDGELYASLLSGEIVKLVGNHVTPVVKFGKPCKGLYEEKLCGRPLGMEFDKDGALVAADAYYGIFKVNVKTGEKVQLVSHNVEINGKKPKLTNSVAVASNGDIFWSDSSTEFLLEDGLIDMFADGSGRLVHYDSKTKVNTVLIDNLRFANGIALSKDEDFVLVAETGSSAIRRYYLKGSKKGAADMFIEGLPGLPDNLKADGKGGFFVPLIIAHDSDHPLPTQFLAPWPFVRKVISRIFGLTEFAFHLIEQVYPNEYSKRAIHFIGHFTSANLFMPKRVTILHLSHDGEIIESWHTTQGKLSGISEIHVFKDQVFLGSPFNDYIGRIPAKKLGLEGYGKKEEKPKVTVTTPKPSPKPTPKPTPTPTTEKPKVVEKPTQKVPEKVPTTEKPKVTTTTTTTTTTTKKPQQQEKVNVDRKPTQTTESAKSEKVPKQKKEL